MASPLPSSKRHFICVTRCSNRDADGFTSFNWLEMKEKYLSYSLFLHLHSPPFPPVSLETFLNISNQSNLGKKYLSQTAHTKNVAIQIYLRKQVHCDVHFSASILPTSLNKWLCIYPSIYTDVFIHDNILYNIHFSHNKFVQINITTTCISSIYGINYKMYKLTLYSIFPSSSWKVNVTTLI